MVWMISNYVPDHKLANAFPGHNRFAFESAFMSWINLIWS